MNCKRCGNQLADNARVCGKCGQTVAKRPIPQKLDTPAPSQPSKIPYPPKISMPPKEAIRREIPEPQHIPNNNELTYAPSPKKEKHSFTKKESSKKPTVFGGKQHRLIRYLIIVLVIATVGFGSFMLYEIHHDVASIPTPESVFDSNLIISKSKENNITYTYTVRTSEDHSHQTSYYIDCLKNANGIAYNESLSEERSNYYANYRKYFPSSDGIDYPTSVFQYLEKTHNSNGYRIAVSVKEYGWQDGFYKTEIVIYNINNCKLIDIPPAPKQDSTSEEAVSATFVPEGDLTHQEAEVAIVTGETEVMEVKPTGNFSSAYITDGSEYTIAVGDSFSMYHPRTPTSPYYAYTWIVESGEDCVELDGDQGTCNVIGIKPGTVKLSANLDYTVVLGYSSESYSYEYEVTIHVKESGNYDHGDVTDGLCPRCHGTRTVDCTVCYGDGKLSSGKACDNCSNGKVTCHYCDGSGTWK